VTGRLAQADALEAHAGPPGRPDSQTPSPGMAYAVYTTRIPAGHPVTIAFPALERERQADPLGAPGEQATIAARCATAKQAAWRDDAPRVSIRSSARFGIDAVVPSTALEQARFASLGDDSRDSSAPFVPPRRHSLRSAGSCQTPLTRPSLDSRERLRDDTSIKRLKNNAKRKRQRPDYKRPGQQ